MGVAKAGNLKLDFIAKSIGIPLFEFEDMFRCYRDNENLKEHFGHMYPLSRDLYSSYDQERVSGAISGGFRLIPVAFLRHCYRSGSRRLVKIFNKRCLGEYLNNSQFAYRSGGSCVNALLKMQHTFLAALDKRDTLAVRMFTMDFSHNLLVEKLKHSPLDSFIVNWYVNFLEGKKQRVIFNNLTCQWKIVNKGTTQGSVSGPFLFNIFLNDLEIDGYKDISLFKYADALTVLVTISKDSPDISDIGLSKFMDWTVPNDMHCNTSKCKELIMRKRGNSTVYPMSHNIKQYNNISLLGVTIQGNCKFGLHVKAKLHEANKCLFVIRSLRKDGYTQDELDHLFNSIDQFRYIKIQAKTVDFSTRLLGITTEFVGFIPMSLLLRSIVLA